MSARADTDGFSWLNLAQSLGQQETFGLAERAYEQACLADPANADLLRARADNLMRAGHAAKARELLQHLGDAPPAPPKPAVP
jgi:cytochrome c-type biogenesis protein CcmH/NrfG